MSENTIVVSTSTDSRWTLGKVKVSPDELAKNLEDLIGDLSESFKSARSKLEGATLSEVVIAVEIGAQGKVSLLGTGGSASAKGGLQLKFTFENEAT
jgi:ribosomal protein L1